MNGAAMTTATQQLMGEVSVEGNVEHVDVTGVATSMASTDGVKNLMGQPPILYDVAERDYLIDTASWTAASAEGTEVFSWDAMKLLLQQNGITRLAVAHNFFACDGIELKIRILCSPSVFGSLMMYALPCTDEAPWSTNLYLKSMYPYVTAGSTEGSVEITLPWLWPQNALELDYTTGGVLNLPYAFSKVTGVVLAPLASVADASTASASYTVMAKFVNPRFYGQRVERNPDVFATARTVPRVVRMRAQAGRRTNTREQHDLLAGKVNNMATQGTAQLTDAASTASSAVSGVVGVVAGAVHALAAVGALFGLAKPTVTDDTPEMVPRYAPGATYVEGVNHGAKLAYTKAAAIADGTNVMGEPVVGLLDPAMKPYIVLNGPMSGIYAIPNCPFYNYMPPGFYGGDSAEHMHMKAPVGWDGYLCAMAGKVAFSFEYLVNVEMSPLMSGSMKVSFVEGSAVDYAATANKDFALDLPSLVYECKGSTCFQFVVPYTGLTNWMDTPPLPGLKVPGDTPIAYPPEANGADWPGGVLLFQWVAGPVYPQEDIKPAVYVTIHRRALPSSRITDLRRPMWPSNDAECAAVDVNRNALAMVAQCNPREMMVGASPPIVTGTMAINDDMMTGGGDMVATWLDLGHKFHRDSRWSMPASPSVLQPNLVVGTTSAPRGTYLPSVIVKQPNCNLSVARSDDQITHDGAYLYGYASWLPILWQSFAFRRGGVNYWLESVKSDQLYFNKYATVYEEVAQGPAEGGPGTRCPAQWPFGAASRAGRPTVGIGNVSIPMTVVTMLDRNKNYFTRMTSEEMNLGNLVIEGITTESNLSSFEIGVSDADDVQYAFPHPPPQMATQDYYNDH